MASQSFTYGNIAPGDVPSNALLRHFDWVWLCFYFCWPGKKYGMVCLAETSRSSTSFQKVKYLSPICNSSKTIGSNKLFPKNVLYVWNDMSIRFLWLEKLPESLCFIIEASLPSYVSDLSIPSVYKEYFTHLLKCHNKAWVRPMTLPYERQCEHRRHKCRLSNTSSRKTQAALSRARKKK